MGALQGALSRGLDRRGGEWLRARLLELSTVGLHPEVWRTHPRYTRYWVSTSGNVIGPCGKRLEGFRWGYGYFFHRFYTY